MPPEHHFSHALSCVAATKRARQPCNATQSLQRESCALISAI
jgi:hypothetical protein